MKSPASVAQAYRQSLNKVHPMVRWSTHFVDRVIQREIPEKEVFPILFRTLRNHLLEVIFDSVRQDFSTRIQCDGYVVTARYFEDEQILLITTAYPGYSGRTYEQSS